jgi:hypothetical protein
MGTENETSDGVGEDAQESLSRPHVERRLR